MVLVIYTALMLDRDSKLNTQHVDLERIKPYRIMAIAGIGIVTGILSGMLGIGGGSVLVPCMVYLFGLSQRRAHGTSLAYMSPIALIAALLYSRHGSVDWVVAIELAVGGVIGAMFGARLCAVLSSRKLRLFFGLFLAVIGLRMLWELKAAFAATAAVSPILLGHALPPDHLLGGFAVVLIGVLTGVLSGMLGIGGGVVMVPILVLIFGFTQRMAQGVSLAVIIPTSISGTLIHNKHGNVNWNVAAWLIVGGIIGAVTGAGLANFKLNEPTLKGLFGLLMLITGVIMARHRNRRV